MDTIKSIKITETTSNSISGYYDIPNGFFDFIYILCNNTEAEDNFELINLSTDKNFSCLDILSGYKYSIKLYTFKNEIYNISNVFFASTSMFWKFYKKIVMLNNKFF